MKKSYDLGRDVLKLIAIITMTIDHLGAIIFTQNVILRVIGRIAFPIFSYLLVLGFESTRNVNNYLLRLFIFAIISQLPFSLALGYGLFESLNIFFTLLFGVMFLMEPILALIPLTLSFFIYFDYGLYGIVVIYCMNLLQRDIKEGSIAFIVLNLLFFALSPTQTFSLLSLPLIILHKKGILKKETHQMDVYPVWRKYLFYIYYPSHLTALYLAKIYLF